MKRLTLAQAKVSQAAADTPELKDALIAALLEVLGLYEADPDQAAAIDGLNKQLKEAIQQKTEAEEIANNAMEAANKIIGSVPQALIVTVGKSDYKVLFGVDGLTKEELAKDKKKLEVLVKKGSGALELQEDN